MVQLWKEKPPFPSCEKNMQRQTLFGVPWKFTVSTTSIFERTSLEVELLTHLVGFGQSDPRGYLTDLIWFKGIRLQN